MEESISKSNTGRKKLLAIIPILLILLTLITLTNIQVIKNRYPGTLQVIKDPAQFLLIGYNLEKYHTLSLEFEGDPTLNPTAFREPVFPALIAIALALNPDLRDATFEYVYHHSEIYLAYFQIFILLIICLLLMYITFKFTKNILLSFLVLILTGFGITAGDLVSKLYSEHVAALFILCTAILMYKIYENKKIIYFILLGISLALLVLTKTIFMYFIIFILLIFLIFFIKERLTRKKIITGALLFIVFYSIIVGGWMYRNYREFGHFFISNRSGSSLLIREVYDANMTNREILASFLYWTPIKSIDKTLLRKFFKPAEYENLDRDNENGYYKTAGKIWDSSSNNKYRIINKKASMIEKDIELQNMAIKMKLEKPLRSVLTTPAFAWQGIFVERGYNIYLPFFRLEKINIYAINILLFISFFALIILSIKRKNWGQLIFLSLPFYLYAIDSILSNNITRYNTPIIPFLNLAFILCIFYLFKFISKKFEYGNKLKK